MLMNCCAIVSLCVVCVALLVPLWMTSSADTSGHNCERVYSTGFLREPMNAISNILAILLSQVFMLMIMYECNTHTKGRQYDHLVNSYLWLVLYALTVFCVGVSGYLYHATLTHSSLVFSSSSTHALLLFLILYFIDLSLKSNAFIELMKYSRRRTLAMFHIQKRQTQRWTLGCISWLVLCDVLVICLDASFDFIIDSHVIVPVACGVVVIEALLWYCYFAPKLTEIVANSEKKISRDDGFVSFDGIGAKIKRFGIVTVGLTAGALLARELDLVVCDPDSWMQMYGLYHVLIGVALYTGFVALRQIERMMFLVVIAVETTIKLERSHRERNAETTRLMDLESEDSAPV